MKELTDLRNKGESGSITASFASKIGKRTALLARTANTNTQIGAIKNDLRTI